LSTRARGAAVADEVLRAMTSHEAVVIDFAGVEVATPSFLDELLARLRGQLRRDEGGTFLLIARPNEDVGESLDLVLRNRNLALAQLEEGEVRLLGGAAHLRETLKAAQTFDSFTATELADHLQVKLPNLHQRLLALQEAGALRRERDPAATRGKRYRFTAARPLSPSRLTPDRATAGGPSQRSGARPKKTRSRS
jgi:hypothetical protein